jgi:hypothetical protein
MAELDRKVRFGPTFALECGGLHRASLVFPLNAARPKEESGGNSRTPKQKGRAV